MDEDCEHLKDDGLKHCDEDFCFQFYVTTIDKLVISIGFNIFILFYYLRDIFPENREKLMVFYFDEKNDLASSFDKRSSSADLREQQKILSKDKEEELRLLKSSNPANLQQQIKQVKGAAAAN